MSTIIGTLKLDIYRKLHHVINSGSKDPIDLSLIAATKKVLSNLDESKWDKQVSGEPITAKEFISDSEKFLTSEKEYLVLFLLLNCKIDSLNSEFLDIVIFFVDSFLLTRVNPHNYKKYLDYLTQEDFSEQLQRLDLDDLLYFLNQIIPMLTIDDLNSKNYRELFRKLSAFRKVPYSPIFKGDYSIFNVYFTSIEIIESQKNMGRFTHEERERLEMLARLDQHATAELKKTIADRIIELENRFQENEIALIKAISRSVPFFVMESHRFVENESIKF